MEEGYLIDGPTVSRIANCVRAYEGNQIGVKSGPYPDGYGRTVAVYQSVKVTGAAISAGFYPGKVRVWDNTVHSWSDGVDCRIREASGRDLIDGETYHDARLVGVDNIAGVDYLVFMVAVLPKQVLTVVTGVNFVNCVLTYTTKNITFHGLVE